ncbi:MAG: hypothetical protein GY765_22150, partial [bacterium]|nr:hypothetical protein [bacterium]
MSWFASVCFFWPVANQKKRLKERITPEIREVIKKEAILKVGHLKQQMNYTTAMEDMRGISLAISDNLADIGTRAPAVLILKIMA